MKRLTIMTAAVLLVSAALCAASLMWIGAVLEEARDRTTEIFTGMESGDIDGVREGLVQLAAMWEEKEGMLEVLCDHEDLHNVRQYIIQAQICMEYTDMEDFYASVSLIGEGIDHIRDEEAPRWSNLL